MNTTTDTRSNNVTSFLSETEVEAIIDKKLAIQAAKARATTAVIATITYVVGRLFGTHAERSRKKSARERVRILFTGR